MGDSVIITGILRVALVYKPHFERGKCLSIDIYSTLELTNGIVIYPKAELWTNIHIGTAIMCCCLPLYRPLFSKASAQCHGLREEHIFRFGRSRTAKESDIDSSYGLARYPTRSNLRYEELHEEPTQCADVSNLTQVASGYSILIREVA